MPARRLLGPPVLVLLVITAAASPALGRSAKLPATGTGWVATRRATPPGTDVRDAAGAMVAQLTDGSRTVSIVGPARQFTEPGVAASVTSDRYARLLPKPYDGVFDSADSTWLKAALADSSIDILGAAFQYTLGAPNTSVNGIRISGDARYGLAAGADFNDYLGVAWTYGTSVDQPEPDEYGALDCSGFSRMIFGYRFGMPMSISSSAGKLPRRAADQLTAGPGRVITPNTGAQVTSFTNLLPGDLVFFDASDRDGTAIDHVGIYVGRDGAAHYRFISSRLSADGPTMGDIGSVSILDGTGYWAQAFRAVRRL
jgi:cell wall-associated NlpC family hydrolase